MIKIWQKSSGKTHLIHPLLRFVLPYPFPHVLDFDKLYVLHVGSNFIMENDFARENWPHHNYYMYTYYHVIAVTSHEKNL